MSIPGEEVYELVALREEIERLKLGFVAITDETITDIGELRNIAREYLGWPARDYRT